MMPPSATRAMLLFNRVQHSPCLIVPGMRLLPEA
jgi:hypothetical protein